jgi:hypothetical protein
VWQKMSCQRMRLSCAIFGVTNELVSDTGDASNVVGVTLGAKVGRGLVRSGIWMMDSFVRFYAQIAV